MAETLTELVAKIETDAAGLKSGLSDAEQATEASSKKMQDSLQKVGTVMAASGAAITAALGLMGKAAIDEDINMKRLATTINNAGTAYDGVKDSLEAVIAATQRKTGIADDEQRDILNRLILVTNDYGKAMELLPTVLDLAAAGEMDATTAATYLGKAYLELQDGAEKVSVRFGQASLQFKNMEDIQNRVAGAAENLANPLSVLKASIGDVAEAIGMNLIPMIKGAIDKIVDIAIKVQDWINENPKLAKTLTVATVALGGILTVVGGLILILPSLISGVAAFGVVFHAALGPIGLISLAIAGLITAGIALYKNWDKVVYFFQDAWSHIKQFFLNGVDFVLELLQKFVGWIPGLGDKIDNLRDKISRIIDAEKIKRDAKDAERALKDVGEALKETTEIVEQNTDATKEQTEAALGNIEALKEQKEAQEILTKATMEQFLANQKLIDQQKEMEKLQAAAAFAAVGNVRMLLDQLALARGTSALGVAEATTGLLTSYIPPELREEVSAAVGPHHLPTYQHGGIVENTGLAYVHEGETVIPKNESMGNVIVNFTQPVFFDREDDMNRFVDKISKTLDRKYRLSGRL